MEENRALTYMEMLAVHIPCVIFSIGYSAIIGDIILTGRIKRVICLKGLIFFMLGSQAFELWSYLQSIVEFIISFCFGERQLLLKFLTLSLLAATPYLLNYLKVRRERQFRFSWRSRGPRTEMGNTGYYLTRPPPDDLFRRQVDTSPDSGLRKTQSQRHIPVKVESGQKNPRSA